MIKAPGLPDWDQQASMVGDDADDGVNMGPMWDQDGVHEIYRGWNRVLAAYPGDRMMVAEAWVRPQKRLARYVRSDEMQQAFNFDYLLARWDAQMLRRVIDTSLQAAASVGAPTTWVMSNHDTVRHTSRLGLSHPGIRPKGIAADGEQPDEALGLRRAMAMLTLALPGSAYLYQGEELGLPEHTTLAAEHRQDPAFRRTGGAEIGRDGCRVPLPWIADAPSFGFGPGAVSWLPQPAGFAGYAVDRQDGVPGSTLELYRTLLRLRRSFALGQGEVSWQEKAGDLLAFDNGQRCCIRHLLRPVMMGSTVALRRGRHHRDRQQPRRTRPAAGGTRPEELAVCRIRRRRRARCRDLQPDRHRQAERPRSGSLPAPRHRLHRRPSREPRRRTAALEHQHPESPRP